MTLTDRHKEVLTSGSGIAEEVIEARGYRTLDRREAVELVMAEKFSSGLTRAEGAIAIPVHRPDGEQHCEIIRLDTPARNGTKSLRYLWPRNTPNAIDINPLVRQYVRDPAIPLIVSEGVKKLDAILSRMPEDKPFCTAALNGAYGWKASVGIRGTTTACQDWYDIALTDRKIIVVVDSDYLTNPDVRRGWDECCNYLLSKAGESKVSLVIVPPKGLDKQGADDYLLDHTLDELLALAKSPQTDVPQEFGKLRAVTWKEALDASKAEVPFIVKTAIPERSITGIVGHTETFKTWHAMTLLLDGALGYNYLNHPDLMISVPTNAVYINKEMGAEMFGTRIRKLIRAERYGRPDIEEIIQRQLMLVDDGRMNFAKPESVRMLTDLIGEHEAKLVVVDSLSMSWSGNENDASEVGGLYQTWRQIIQDTGCSIVFIHHMVKPSKDRGGINPIFWTRGSGQIIQQADSAFLLDKIVSDETTDIIKIVQGKARASRHLETFATRVEEHDGVATSVLFEGLWKDTKAAEYASNPNDTSKADAWVTATLIEQPRMYTDGMRTSELVNFLQVSWPDKLGTKGASKSSLIRAFKRLTEAGTLLVADTHATRGDLYKLPLPTDDESETFLPPTPDVG